VLERHLLAWVWSLLAAVAHEVTAAGCMLSAAALASTAAAAAQERSQSVGVDELLSHRNAARRELEAVPEERSRSQRLPSPLMGSAGGSAEPPAAAGSSAAPPVPLNWWPAGASIKSMAGQSSQPRTPAARRATTVEAHPDMTDRDWLTHFPAPVTAHS
jgi:hypothetical protein